MTTFRIATLARLVDGWKETSQVRSLVRKLEDEMAMSKAPFEGAPLPEKLTAGRLPAGIASGWIFVLRAQTTAPAHFHPNSVQHMAVIAGTGKAHIGKRSAILQPFDPAYPERSIYIIPEKVPHAIEAFHEHVVVMSFHTVSASELLEVEVLSGQQRTYAKPSPP